MDDFIVGLTWFQTGRSASWEARTLSPIRNSVIGSSSARTDKLTWDSARTVWRLCRLTDANFCTSSTVPCELNYVRNTRFHPKLRKTKTEFKIATDGDENECDDYESPRKFLWLVRIFEYDSANHRDLAEYETEDMK